MQVFNPNEFPDVPSGSVSEKLVTLGYETFIRIDSSTLITEDETRRYSSETVRMRVLEIPNIVLNIIWVQRGCLFPDELPEKFGGRYKRSDCVVNCRIESIAALCNCRMFYLPTNQQDNKKGGGKTTGVNDRDYDDVPMCTLEHVQCLNHYRSLCITYIIVFEVYINICCV